MKKPLLSVLKELGSRDNFFTLGVVCFSIALLFIPTGFGERFSRNVKRVRGLVLEVDNSAVQQFGIVKTGTQDLKIRILDSHFKGKEVYATNHLLGKMELDKFFTVGDTALVVLDVGENEIKAATAFDHFRGNTEVLLLGIFAVFLIVFARWIGAKALLSFLFTGLVVWKVILQGFLRGWDPILLSLGMITTLTAVIIFLIGKLSKRGVVAFLGSFLVILLTCTLALVFSSPFHLHGAIRPFSETLIYSGFPHLSLTRIFLAGIFIAASGAVMDIAMDISASMNEFINKKPDISRRELIKSGFTVRRAVIGTMTTTLLLAYSGGYTAMLMLFISQGFPLSSIMNINYVAAEIFHTLVGSFGLVTVAPFTAIIGGLIYATRRK